MNGPRHYAEAEQLLAGSWDSSLAIRALTHAVLALAAAHAENDGADGRAEAEINRWVKVGALEPYYYGGSAP